MFYFPYYNNILELYPMEGNFVVNFYPVKLDIIDVIIVEFIVIIIGLITSYYPSKVLTDRFLRS